MRKGRYVAAFISGSLIAGLILACFSGIAFSLEPPYKLAATRRYVNYQVRKLEERIEALEKEVEALQQEIKDTQREFAAYRERVGKELAHIKALVRKYRAETAEAEEE